MFGFIKSKQKILKFLLLIYFFRKILFAFFLLLLQICGTGLPYDKLSELRQRLYEVSPNLVYYGEAEDANFFKEAHELSSVSKNQFFSYSSK